MTEDLLGHYTDKHGAWCAHLSGLAMLDQEHIFCLRRFLHQLDDLFLIEAES